MDKDKKEFGKWWLWVLALLALTVMLIFTLRIGGVFVDRVAFEASYQRSESIKTQIATYEAQMVELQSQLNDPNIIKSAKDGIRAQMALLRVQINAAKAKR